MAPHLDTRRRDHLDRQPHRGKRTRTHQGVNLCASLQLQRPIAPTFFDRYLLSQLPTGRLLNLGAGLGLIVDGRRVINVDHVPPPKPNEAIYVLADATNLPFRVGSFDGALLKDLIEHLDNPVRALAEAARTVRVGGVITVEVPRAIPRAVWGDPTHIRGFTARALEATMRMAGILPDRPVRMGGFPGAGRFRLVPWLGLLMRIPGFGHWYGTNWLVHGHIEADQLPNVEPNERVAVGRIS